MGFYTTLDIDYERINYLIDKQWIVQLRLAFKEKFGTESLFAFTIGPLSGPILTAFRQRKEV